MTLQTYEEFVKDAYTIPGSGAADSYINAVKIIDRLFEQYDRFNLCGMSVKDIQDLDLLSDIVNFVIEEEHKFKNNNGGFFKLLGGRQNSYPKAGWCSRAASLVVEYRGNQQLLISSLSRSKNSKSGKEVSQEFIQHLQLNKKAGERVTQTRVRVGQDLFRQMLLEIYNRRCCITGLDVPKLLRASHIVAWAEDENNRLNPENGLCLSATYDAAFDQHLISFDDDYKMIVSKEIKEHYTTEVTKEYFYRFEGKKMNLPTMYLPNKELLAKHRDLLVG